MKVLVCGGAGYIGSHTCVALLQHGHEVVIFDSLVNSSPFAVENINILGKSSARFVLGDVRDRDALEAVLAEGFDAVIHFAGLKVACESLEKPLVYFDNNIVGTLTLLQAMQATGVRNLVFSSSASVYGQPDRVPISENAPLRVINPYGRSKLVMEQLIGEFCLADPRFSAILLRYFNPAGAHPSGQLGEDPSGSPSNLVPYVAQVAAGLHAHLSIFGNDYPTHDGTGVRDYIHVMDLADAHMKALDRLDGGGCIVMNLGAGRGYSVLDVVAAFERVCGRPVPYVFEDRRPGDVAEVWADPSLAERTLGWRARYGLRRMCEDAWRWQIKHPHGFRREEARRLSLRRLSAP
ncbi:UDP-galactose 4-epimerase [Dyella jiangningensis]|uniref:UDP-glucose 4-epimerase GalE n=1 Tax=Dyella sp. AtDHG13 TaxID=1938897 RepID=UPI000884F248|nr:UDP-glucose 4-epimerase GalE [Dyella sp. AtDHG13]PXV60519.1 UDP-galactose 4-epimerase [Dyella sp. AtDHG13]SDJ48658.1 UDP-galactose 4-epimerase [Dyella jiangningensis]